MGKPINTTKFGSKLFDLMDERRWIQKDLLEAIQKRTGVRYSQPFMSKLNLDKEKGTIWPSSQFVLYASQAFDLTPDAMMLDIDLGMGKEISAMAKIMMALDDDGRAKLLATARDMLGAQRNERQKNLTTIEALIQLIETNGSREIKDRAGEIIGRYIPAVTLTA